MDVAIIGVGNVGSCLLASLAPRGVSVTGIDTNIERVAELNSGRTSFREPGLSEALSTGHATGHVRATTDYAACTAAKVLVVTVGTPIHPDGSVDDSYLKSACTMLAPHLRRDHLLIVKSTVPPGGTRAMVEYLAASGLHAGVDFDLAFSPERLSEGNAMKELSSFPMVVGGINRRSAAAAATFWDETLGVPVITTDSLEAAEIVKLADNWWIDLNIALANELAQFCEIYGVDVLDVISAANSIPKGNGSINILLPSIGVGGSCLTKDPWMVAKAARSNGLQLRTPQLGREVNSAMPEIVAEQLLNQLAVLGKKAHEAKIAVLGVTFKNDTSDLRSTPVLPAVQSWVKAGATVSLFDPIASASAVKQVFGIGLEATVQDATRDADCIAVLALHREFRDLDFDEFHVNPDCIVLDGRAYYTKDRIAELEVIGYRYQGVGR